MVKDLVNSNYLDLRGLICPINYVKCCLALENLSLTQSLKVDLDIGEPETTVIEGLKEKGYKVQILNKNSKFISLLVTSDS
tara:strand:- start:109 stop:351 length:243 start_codon:yes stop_codon:yes gene_type:complete